MKTNQSDSRLQLSEDLLAEEIIAEQEVTARDVKAGILGKRLDLIIIANLPVYLN